MSKIEITIGDSDGVQYSHDSITELPTFYASFSPPIKDQRLVEGDFQQVVCKGARCPTPDCSLRRIAGNEHTVRFAATVNDTDFDPDYRLPGQTVTGHFEANALPCQTKGHIYKGHV